MNDSPLLASEDDLATPLLSSGPQHDGEQEDESRLSLLIRKSPNSSQIPLQSKTDTDCVDVPTTFSTTAVTNLIYTDPLSPPISRVAALEVSLVTVVTCTLSIFQIGWVWGSYLTKNGWSDLYLSISIQWQSSQQQPAPFSSTRATTTETLLESIDLASLMHTSRALEQYPLLALLPITAILLPCLCMVIHPMWIWQHYASYWNDSETTFSRNSYYFVRNAIRWYTQSVVVRLSFVVLYGLVLLQLATWCITLQWTHTVLSVHSVLKGGYLSYGMGMSAAMLVLMLLRWAREQQHRDDTTDDDSQPSNQATPPRAAFRYPWTGGGTYVPPTEETKELELNTPLLETNSQDGNKASSPPRLGNTPSPQPQQKLRNLGFWRRLCVWEASLFAALFWLAAFVPPLFRLDYRGLAAEFMPRVQVPVYLYQIPVYLWNKAGGAVWMRVACISMVAAQVVVVPLVLWVCAVLAWLEPTHSVNTSTRYRRWVSSLAPAANGMALAVALLVTVPSIETIAEDFLLEDTSGLCQKFEQVAGDKCLELDGTVLIGTWALLCHCVALELFVGLTLWLV